MFNIWGPHGPVPCRLGVSRLNPISQHLLVLPSKPLVRQRGKRSIIKAATQLSQAEASAIQKKAGRLVLNVTRSAQSHRHHPISPYLGSSSLTIGLW